MVKARRDATGFLIPTAAGFCAPLGRQKEKQTGYACLLFFLRKGYEKDTKLKADDSRQKRMIFLPKRFHF